MYYPYTNNFWKKTCHFVFISFLFVAFFYRTPVSFAEVNLVNAGEEYRTVGFKAQQEGDFDRALTFYSKALSLGTEQNVWIYNNVGVIYEQLGMSERAELNYLKALEIDSSYLPPYTNLAFLYKERGDIPKAISYLRVRLDRATANDPWIPTLVAELRALDPTYRTSVIDTELAETGDRLYQMAQEELSLQVARADGHYRHTQELLANQEFEQALLEIEKALALTPDNPKLRELQEQILVKQRNVQVRQKTEKAMELLDSGDVDSARQEFQTILAILPDQSDQK